MLDDIETAVADYLQSIGVTYTATHKGLERDKHFWIHDEWRVQFIRAGKAKPLSAKYMTGYGHRKTKSGNRAGNMPRFRDIADCEKWLREKRAIPTAPPVAAVLDVLFRDSEACIVSFQSWCDELGFDSDSIEALNIYRECERIGQDVREFFSREESEALREMLFDY